MQKKNLQFPNRVDFSTEIQIHEEINLADLFGNSVFIIYIIEALYKFLRIQNIPIDMTMLSELEMNYNLDVMEIGNTLACEISVCDFSLDSCKFLYLIRNKTGAEVLKAATLMFFYDRAQNKKLAVPKRLRDLQNSAENI